MRKSVKLALNNFPEVPPSLQDIEEPDLPVPEIMVELADLYAHYYLHNFDCEPPDPDPTHFEHLRHLMPGLPLRFQRNGLGAHKTKKQNNSNELGEAFCLWFLSQHLGMTHVARIDDVRDHRALAEHAHVSVVSSTDVTGDRPDFFCVGQSGEIALAEAKGSLEAVGFGTKLFQSWRRQFDRVAVLDHTGNPLSVKGYIVAMRWATASHGPNIFTKLSAEDPYTPGFSLFVDETRGFAAAIRSLHYAPSLAKLRQPVLSAALADGSTVTDDLLFQMARWKCLLPNLRNLVFVGGYYPKDGAGIFPHPTMDGKILVGAPNPYRLDAGSGTFFGIEESVFSHLVKTARTGPMSINDLPRLEQVATQFSGVSLLPDGHILGSLEIFQPIDVRAY